jgi:hypothetical protein
MHRVNTQDGSFWIGRLDLVGTVVFDPSFQQDLTDIWARFFVVEEGRWALFTRADARSRVVREALSDTCFLGAKQRWSTVRAKLMPLLTTMSSCERCLAPLSATAVPV